MGAERRRRDRVGWVLFTMCSLAYIIANVRARDWLSLVGSVLFLLACVVFILEPRRERGAGDTSISDDTDES